MLVNGPFPYGHSLGDAFGYHVAFAYIDFNNYINILDHIYISGN